MTFDGLVFYGGPWGRQFLREIMEGTEDVLLEAGGKWMLEWSTCVRKF